MELFRCTGGISFKINVSANNQLVQALVNTFCCLERQRKSQVRSVAYREEAQP